MSPPLAGASTPSHLALIILDGLGDRPHPDTGGMSPVEAARTPNLDALIDRGRLGQVQLIGPGIAPESDAGVLALLGYDPQNDSPGRGVLEAIGIGVPLEPGDVAFRLNFATADGGGQIIDARVGRSLGTAEATELARDLTSDRLVDELGVRAEVRATVGHRGVLWLHPTDGAALSSEVSNSDPFYERLGGMGRARRVEHPKPLEVRPLIDTDPARKTAEVTNRFLQGAHARLPGHSVNARRMLSGRPIANTVLLRNAGGLGVPPLRSFQDRAGVTGVAVTEMPVERGIARLLGLRDEFVGPMGSERDSALKDRARVTRAALEGSPFVYVHLKGPDEPGHDGRAAVKRDIVEAMDRSFFGPFLEGIDWATTRVAVTADHATPCILKAHADDPVPLVLAGVGIEPFRSRGRKFCEREAALGELGTLRGSQVLPRLFGGVVAADVE
jgi:2,3-bisphosphoglycerate-independent phosphoglycerate mutase